VAIVTCAVQMSDIVGTYITNVCSFIKRFNAIVLISAQSNNEQVCVNNYSTH